MLFNSLDFLVFFVVVTVLSYVTNAARRWLLLLLLARCFFYMSFIRAGKRAADFAGDSRFTHICRSRHKYADNTYGKRNLRPKKDNFF